MLCIMCKNMVLFYTIYTIKRNIKLFLKNLCAKGLVFFVKIVLPFYKNRVNIFFNKAYAQKVGFYMLFYDIFIKYYIGGKSDR